MGTQDTGQTIQRQWQQMGKQDTGRRQYRDTGNKWAHKIQDEDNPETLATNGHTRHRTKTIQRHWQQMGTQDTGRRQSRDTGNKWAHKIQDEDNPETLATNRHLRHRTKTNKNRNITQKTKNMSNMNPIKIRGEPRNKIIKWYHTYIYFSDIICYFIVINCINILPENSSADTRS
jgi:hypothetical protein